MPLPDMAATSQYENFYDIRNSTISEKITKEFDNANFRSTKHAFKVHCDVVTLSELTINVENRKLTTEKYVCNGRSNRRLGSIIHVIGGPYQEIGQFPDPYLITYMMAGYDVYFPRYSGTFKNSIATTKGITKEYIENGGELQYAAEEVASLSRYLTAARERVILSGESAGGYIASLSCRWFCPSRLLLLSPLMQSPNEFWNNYAEKGWKNNIFYKPGKDGTEAYKKFLAKNAAIGFYGSAFQYKNLEYVINTSVKKSSVAIFYGNADPRIGVSEIKSLINSKHRQRLYVESYPDSSHKIIQTSPNGERRLIEWLVSSTY